MPYKNTKGIGDKAAKEIRDSEEGGGGLKAIAQARHGNGCCPGQTGHHILPDAMVEPTKCPGYDYVMVPTVGLEGTNNHAGHGSHGLDAIELAGAGRCDRKCLEAQLDKHYKGCVGKELTAHSGSGGGGESQGSTKKGGKK